MDSELMDNSSLESPRMVLIGGSGRSGTSITREVLGSAEGAMCLPFEYRFILDPDGIIDFLVSTDVLWSPYQYNQKVKALIAFLDALGGGDFRYPHLGEHARAFGYQGWELASRFPSWWEALDRLVDELTTFTYQANWVGLPVPKGSTETMRFGTPPQVLEALRGFCWRVISSGLDVEGKSFLVEDNTWNILYADRLNELFPDSVFIHVYRDPRDVLASMRGQSWCPSDIVQLCSFYHGIMDRWDHIKSSLPQSWFTELSLEQFVEDQEAFSRACHVAGIDPDSVSSRDRLSAASFGRWRSDFTSEEQSRIEELLGVWIDRYGYSSSP